MRLLTTLFVLAIVLALAGCKTDPVLEKTGKSGSSVRDAIVNDIDANLLQAIDKMKAGEPALQNFQRICDNTLALYILFDEVPQKQEYWKGIGETFNTITRAMLNTQGLLVWAMYYELVPQPITSFAKYDRMEKENPRKVLALPPAEATKELQENVFRDERLAYTYFLMDKPALSAGLIKNIEDALAHLKVAPSRLPFFYLEWAYFLHKTGDDVGAGRKLDEASAALFQKGEDWACYYPLTEKEIGLWEECIRTLSGKLRP
jgi:hypothetical protein